MKNRKKDTKKTEGNSDTNKNGNGVVTRPNNTQRKELAKLVEEKYRKEIIDARDKNGEITARIKEQISEELGVNEIDRQIRDFEERIEELKKQKGKTGFGIYNLEDGSKAKLLFDKRIKEENMEVSQLEERRIDDLTAIWAAQTMAEVITVVNGI